MIAEPRAEVKPKGTGWQEPVPLSSPPGVAILDKLMDNLDASERRQRELAKKLSEK
jgi:hypothetical protein